MKTRYTTEIFIEKAIGVHGNKYDYSKVDYRGSKEKICIICPKHGEFWQYPSKHLLGDGCAKCGFDKLHTLKKKDKNTFIKEAKEKWGDKYDYSKVEYINNATKVCIICTEHGEFWQTPANHLSGFNGCRKCNGDIICNTNDFINAAIKTHSNFYDYSKSNFIKCNEKITITCPIHGDFKQNAYNHAILGYGCPKCNMKSSLEKAVRNILTKMGLNYSEQKHFEWLSKQSLDFYLEDYSIGIECQGRQHFIDGSFNEGLNVIIDRDIRKKTLCEENNINIIYVVNRNYNNINDEIYDDKNLFDIKELELIINQVIKKENEK